MQAQPDSPMKVAPQDIAHEVLDVPEGRSEAGR
jgi:hypothetical protein